MPDSCPIWDLNDLYSGINDVKLTSDLAVCRKSAASMQDSWQGLANYLAWMPQISGKQPNQTLV